MQKKMMVYGMGIFVSKLLVFLMVPIYTRTFSTADYGYYDVIVSNIQMIASISFIEIWSGIIRFMFDYKDRYKPLRVFVRLFPIFLTIYIVLLIILGNIIRIKYPFLIMVYGIAYILFNCSNSVCRGLESNIDYVISGLIGSGGNCVLNILFCVILKKSILFLFISQIISYIAAIMYVEMKTGAIRKSITSKVEKNDLLEMVKYCLPLMLNAFSYMFLETYNKNVILSKFGEGISGLYALALKFSSIASILISIYTLAWQEEAFALAKDHNRVEKYSKHLNMYIRLVGTAIPIYIIFCLFVVPIVGGDAYLGTIKFIPLSIFVTFLASTSGVLSILLTVEKKTVQLLLSTVFGAVINIIIMQFLPDMTGEISTNISLCFAYFGIVIWRYLQCKIAMDLRFDSKWLLIVIIEIVILFLMVNYSNEIIYCGLIVIYMGIWSATNWKLIKSLFTTISKKLRKE